MLKFMAFFGITLLALSCGAGTNPVSRLDMVGGQVVPEDSPAYVSTVSLAKISRSGFDSFCSGTLIAPNLVLTAAHCVEGFKNTKQFIVLFGKGDDDPNAVTIPVANFQSYRPKDGSRYYPNFDIAWVKLEGEAPAGFQPAEILRSSDQLKPLLNQTDSILLAGYGRTKTDCPSTDPTCSGQRLQVQTYLRRFVNTSHFSQLMVIGPKPLSGTCSGDSGGSAFAKIKDRWYVLGDLNGKNLALNTSAVWDAARICESGESIYTFAGAYVDWLQESSGVTLSFNEQLNPKGPGLLPLDAPSFLGPNPDLAKMLAYNNPNDPLWVTAEALMSSFGEEGKREIADLGQVVTDPKRAASIMATWTVFKYTGVSFDISNLALKDRQLSDLRPIVGLKNLQKLELIGNRLTDVAPLGQLENLQELTLGNNYDFNSKAKLPYDFNFLNRLKKLRVLNLATNGGNLDLKDIPWDSLGQLEVLDLSANDTIQLDAVKFAKLPRLHTLIVANAGLTNIEALAEARGLRSLDLRNNNIQDINVLSNLPQVQMLDLSQNQIEDFSSVADLKELKTLKALANPQKITACPAGAQCLYNPDPQTTFAAYCEFSKDLSEDDRALWQPSKTIILLLREAGQKDIASADCAAADAVLRSKKKLEFSGLKAAPWITDLTPLMPLKQLEELVLDHQSFHDLSPLLALAELRSLNLASNKLKRVDVLAGLPNLQRLVLDSNQLTDISALAAHHGLWVSAVGNPDLPKICPIPGGQCIFEKPGTPP
ncbi:MAG TPA: leucine-rich repeat domain-containing protein [Oligoflexus sp.]|uniref:leucine-rich repeat domain-containing protein n=1 Tax=Oligoflexus sp. TaxID=1971216 RepID=UPI002D670AAA|nr:leucine-rich repeat domain-containing protein [Oligoflexus sp.]HYX38739.1 leucine-rich repeat domain-containing protein [Oligoflexus sp.]